MGSGAFCKMKKHKNPCRKPGTVTATPVTPVLWRMEMAGSLGFAGCQSSSRFSERPW